MISCPAAQAAMSPLPTADTINSREPVGWACGTRDAECGYRAADAVEIIGALLIEVHERVAIGNSDHAIAIADGELSTDDDLAVAQPRPVARSSTSTLNFRAGAAR